MRNESDFEKLRQVQCKSAWSPGFKLKYQR